MANFSFDVAKGREVEFWNRVNDSDPTNAVLVLAVLTHTGIVSDATMKSYATLSALLAGASNEVTNTGYARITLSDSGIGAPTVDNTAHTTTLPLADQVTGSITAGDNWSKLIVGYDSDSTGGTDANIIPVFALDIRVSGVPLIPNGTAVTFSFPFGLAVAS